MRVSALDPERWREISPYLDRALDLNDEERSAWLQSLRASQPEIAATLGQLLKVHEELAQEGFLDRPVQERPEQRLEGQTIGPYTLLSPIGAGGMGSVWLAERSDGRFERRVAVKFLRFAVAASGSAERFQREGRILGQLSHPHIAELIDAGVTASGEPYLVLEYVEGEPIDEYCDARKLDVDSRLRLFLDVVDAVVHAHTHLAVHRDIKPSNVLVRKDGQVKLLDFGIAKLLEDSTLPADATLLTLEGGGALTPRFAAPEQLSAGQIITATDVYALGVLLYLLLAGQHPAGRGPYSTAALVKAIVETEPPLASDAAALCGADCATLRATTPEKLSRQLRGDLDTILTKSLKKKPGERYTSVAAFGDDLHRYLAHQPIAARPDALPYRVRKYIRRHRIGVSAATAIALLLIGFAIVQAVQLRRITRERDRANRIADFMTGVFKVSDPSERVGNAVTARQLLDKASQQIETDLANDPALQGQMLHVMGKAYMMLGLDFQAQPLFERSAKLDDAAIGPDNPETLSTMNDLSWTLFQQGRLTEAEALERKLLDRERRVLGPDHQQTLGTMDQLASTLCEEDKCAEAVKVDREVLEREKRASGDEANSTLETMDNLSVILASAGQLAEAEKLEQQTLDIQIRMHGFENLGTISSMINLASIQRDIGKYDQAEKLFRQTLDLEARVLGPDQPETAETKYDLAGLLARRGSTQEALALLREAIDHGLHPRIDLKIATEPDFASLHGNPEFAALVAHAKKQAASHSLD